MQGRWPPKFSFLNPGGIPILVFTYTHKLRRRNSSDLHPQVDNFQLRCWTCGHGKAGNTDADSLRDTGTSPTQAAPAETQVPEQTHTAARSTPPLFQQGPPRCHAGTSDTPLTPPTCLLFSGSQSHLPRRLTPPPQACAWQGTQSPHTYPSRKALPMSPPSPKARLLAFSHTCPCSPDSNPGNPVPGKKTSAPKGQRPGLPGREGQS